MSKKVFMLTVQSGKRLIAKGILKNADVKNAIENHRLVVIAGTTNAYIMEEISNGFDSASFRRGVTVAPGTKISAPAQVLDCVVTKDGIDQSRDIFAIAPTLGPGDVILKGANAVNLSDNKAGVLIASEIAGTIGACVPHVIGRRVKMILPVGVEKRVTLPIDQLADMANEPDGTGPRLYAAPGKAYTEIDAFNDLCGVEAHVLASGGVMGAEGATYFLCQGTDEQLEKCSELCRSIMNEPPLKL